MVHLYTRTRPGVTLLMLETFEVYATSCLVVLFIPKNQLSFGSRVNVHKVHFKVVKLSITC
jgi:hypothetical protein